MPSAELVVKVGKTKVRVLRANKAASAGPTPWTRNTCSRWRQPPSSRHSPTTPLQMIMMAENSVSRARVTLPVLSDNMKDRISATSITVTDNARIKVPRGSPVRWATTSAWCTAESTAKISMAARRTRLATGHPPSTVWANPQTARAIRGTTEW